MTSNSDREPTTKGSSGWVKEVVGNSPLIHIKFCPSRSRTRLDSARFGTIHPFVFAVIGCFLQRRWHTVRTVNFSNNVADHRAQRQTSKLNSIECAPPI